MQAGLAAPSKRTAPVMANCGKTLALEAKDCSQSRPDGESSHDRLGAKRAGARRGGMPRAIPAHLERFAVDLAVGAGRAEGAKDQKLGLLAFGLRAARSPVPHRQSAGSGARRTRAAPRT